MFSSFPQVFPNSDTHAPRGTARDENGQDFFSYEGTKARRHEEETECLHFRAFVPSCEISGFRRALDEFSGQDKSASFIFGGILFPSFSKQKSHAKARRRERETEQFRIFRGLRAFA